MGKAFAMDLRSSGSPEPSIVCALTEEQVMCIAQAADRGFFP